MVSLWKSFIPTCRLGYSETAYGQTMPRRCSRMTYVAVSFLFTGDLEAKGEQTLLHSGSPIASNVLKVSHHGAAEATTADFIQAVSPQLAVISVGPNRFGHPASETLKRLEHVTVLRTDLYGTIDIRTDGVTCWTDKSP